MVIEINKDIDRYKESVVMGLTAKQLIFSVASVVAGGSIVLLLYRYIGLTPSVYVAIPVVAPIALGGFYSFNGVSFYEVMGRNVLWKEYRSEKFSPIPPLSEERRSRSRAGAGRSAIQRLSVLSN